MALLDRGGRTTWAKLPDDVRNVSYPVELDDGRIFWVTDRGLLRLRNDGTLQRVSAAVRLACGDARGGDGETIVQAMAGGRTLVHADGLLFIIDRKDRVQPVVGQVDCAKRLYRRGFAATNDGSVYFEVEEALYRRDPGGRVRALPVAGTTGTIYSIKTFGDDVLVSAKEGLFHTRSGRSLRRIVPKGHDAELHSTVNDLDGRPLICVDKNVLHRLDAHGDLQPLRAAAGVDCGGWVSRAGSLGLLMLPGGKASPVLVTRDERAIIIPGARVWPVAQLRDGSMILMSLPANPGESWIPGREEESSLPHSLILVSPQGRIEPVAFDGPEVELKPQRDPTWQERSAVRAVHFTSPMLGWAVLGKRGLLSTTVDAGAQWRGVTSDNVPIVGVASLAFTADGRHGIAAGKDALWRTDDAGATWTKTPWQSEIFDVHQIRLLGSAGARAVAVVDRRDHDNIVVELWVSDDGGRTWVAPALPVPGPLAWARNQMAGVGFDAAGRGGWLVAADRLLVTGDGGNT
ncbi:MAG: hypothetical protein IPG91_16865, partial [Ideonella sp.]|nr:hypothetical protein [Ideonella sp.]